MYILAAAIKQAGTTDGPKVREALENLKDKYEGVVKTFDHPYTHDDHEAIKLSDVMLGMVQGGHVVHAK